MKTLMGRTAYATASAVKTAVLLLAVSALVMAGTASAQAPAPATERVPDVIFVPTPDTVIAAMLKAAGVTKDSVVYDLGCGDGRIVVAAARDFGARAVGIDIDPVRIKEANENAKKNGVTDRVKFIQGDLFTADIKEATAVTLYLLPSLNVKLRPKLQKELKPGTPIVSHAFDMGDWKPEETIQVDGRTVYLWHVGK
jgi:SAM-dependent methyltransferase